MYGIARLEPNKTRIRAEQEPHHIAVLEPQHIAVLEPYHIAAHGHDIERLEDEITLASCSKHTQHTQHTDCTHTPHAL